jgi:predicted DNA-binding transcriptional regulator YafY
MPHQNHFHRYKSILGKLRSNGRATFEEINNTLKKEGELIGRDLSISIRTLQRDIAAISELWYVEIKYDFSRKCYYIASEDEGSAEAANRLLEAFDIKQALSVSNNLSPYLVFENRRAAGTENLFGLLHAIKNKRAVRFLYSKFWNNETLQRTCEPYALKEFKSRWYLLAKDIKDSKTKTFGLDRITELEITKQKFKYPESYRVNEEFRHCFGIIKPDNGKPEKITISLLPEQARYIKTFPLHQSQKIVKETDEEVVFSLFVFITYDFILELLSHGDNLKVLSPPKLKNEIKKIYRSALSHYE